MARIKQQKVKRSLPRKASKTTAKKSRAPAKKTTGKPSVASEATSAKLIHKSIVSKKPAIKKARVSKKVIQKTSASNKSATKVKSAPRSRVQKASASSKSSAPRRSTSKKPSASTTARPITTPPARTLVRQSSSESFAAELEYMLNLNGLSYVQPTPFADKTPWRICKIRDQTTWELNESMSTKKYASWADTTVTLSRRAFERVLNHPQAVYKMYKLRENNELGRSVTLEFNAAYVETTRGKRYNVTNVWVKDLNIPTVDLVWEMTLRTELAALNAPVAQA